MSEPKTTATAPRKWRPSLALVTAGMIGLVLAVAVGGFAIVRFNIDRPLGAELATALVVALFAASVVGVVFVRAISRPLLELVRRAEAIARGDSGAIGPLPHHGTRELARLSDSFMNMARTLSDRSTYLRTYSRHVSHELKTPLTAIRGAAELIQDNDDMTPEQRRRFAGNIIADVARMTLLVERLSEQARAETPPAPAAARVSDVFNPLCEEYPQLAIELSGESDTVVAMSADDLSVVLNHLAANAAAHGAKSLRLVAARHDSFCGIHVQDDGAGITPGNRERVFDPFFTTRRESGGTGMGLSIVRSMLEAHRGAIDVCDSERGACFELRIPLAPLHEKS